jgi:hypothetical protein
MEKFREEKLIDLKLQVKQRIDKKLEKFSSLDKEKREDVYKKIILKIEDLLNKDNLSKKQILIYNILKSIFEDLIKKES